MTQTLRWFAVQTQPQRERVAAKGLDDLDGVTVYLPEAQAEFVRRGRIVRELIPAFPSYVFARMPATAAAWREAYDEPTVIRLLGPGGEGGPTPVPDREINRLRDRERSVGLESPRDGERLKVGASVRVRFGHLVNSVGKLLKKTRQRVRIEVPLLGSSVEVDLPLHAVELVAVDSGNESTNKRPRRKRPAKEGESIEWLQRPRRRPRT